MPAIVVVSGNLPKSINPGVEHLSDSRVGFRQLIMSMVSRDHNGIGLRIELFQVFEDLFEEVPCGDTFQEGFRIAKNVQVCQLNNSEGHLEIFSEGGSDRVIDWPEHGEDPCDE